METLHKIQMMQLQIVFIYLYNSPSIENNTIAFSVLTTFSTAFNILNGLIHMYSEDKKGILKNKNSLAIK